MLERRTTQSSRLPPLLAAAAAIALGVLSADGWRWHLLGLEVLASTQSGWALGAWLTALVVSGGAWRRGALAGAGFGVLAIASYYVYEWLAYDAHAATSQLTSSGVFWVPAAALGGAVCGLLGAAAARPVGDRVVDLSALGRIAIASALVAEAAFLVTTSDKFVGADAFAAAVVLAVAALVVVALTLTRCGLRRTAVALALDAVLAPVAAVAYFVLEHRVGYLTL